MTFHHSGWSPLRVVSRWSWPGQGHVLEGCSRCAERRSQLRQVDGRRMVDAGDRSRALVIGHGRARVQRDRDIERVDLAVAATGSGWAEMSCRRRRAEPRSGRPRPHTRWRSARARGRGAEVGLGVEGLYVLAFDPVLADADVLTVWRGGTAVVLEVVEGGSSSTWLAGGAAGAAGKAGARRGGGGQVGSHRCGQGQGSTWKNRKALVGTAMADAAVPLPGVDGGEAGQLVERGQARRGDDLDVPPLGRPLFRVPTTWSWAGMATSATARRRASREARDDPGGRWLGDGRCRWRWPCTRVGGWGRRWRRI